MAPRTENKAKARMSRRQNLVGKYHIIFDGPIPSREWPTDYAPIFQKFREIEEVKYDEYIENLTYSDGNSSYPSPITERVAELIRVAYDMRNTLANEATWRSGTENLIFKRFEKDIPCNHCRKRRWFPKVVIEPLCPLAAQKLRTKRHRTTLCKCSQQDRAMHQSATKLESPFLYRHSEPIVDDSIPEYKTGELKEQKPDYIIGLRQTAKLRSFLSGTNMIHTPFKKNFSPSFPFLLLEAKPEVGCPGFTSVEEQSAFPLRTLLNIQGNVFTSSESRFYPLVWFMANQGDEWRVYACVPDGYKTRIIDLWHGTILREDSALQLLLIVDMICDWARDIYRKEIMKCLASAASTSRGLTPADSHISYNPFSDEDTFEDQSNDSSADVETNSMTSLLENDRNTSVDSTFRDYFTENEENNDVVSPRAFDALAETSTACENIPDISSVYLDPRPESDFEIVPPRDFDVLTETSTVFDNIVDTSSVLLEPSLVSDVSDVPMTDSSLDNNDDDEFTGVEAAWNRHAVIRHANDVVFLFHHLCLPETEEGLFTLLASSSSGSDIAQAAGKLLILFRAQNQMSIRKRTVRQLEAWWTRNGGDQEIYNNDADDDILFAHFSIDSYFRQEDWGLVRKLTCTVASSNTIEKLAGISGIGHPVINDYSGELRCSTGNFYNATLLLRSLSYEESAKAAISHLHLCLHQDYASFERGRVQYEWRRSTPRTRDALHILENVQSLITVGNSERCRQVRLLTRNNEFDLEFGSTTQMIGAFIVKKRQSWPDSCPKYCLVVFDQSDITDFGVMASKVSNALSYQSFYQETGRGISQEDTYALTLWSQLLSGDAPPDTAWPS